MATYDVVVIGAGLAGSMTLGDGQFCMGEYHYSLVVFGQEGEDSVADAGRRAALHFSALPSR